jgi:uroporphyrinogen-III decarboxylase
VEDVVNAVTKCHGDAGDLYIIGAGCEVPRDTPVENMFALLEFARAHQPGVLLEEVES